MPTPTNAGYRYRTAAPPLTEASSLGLFCRASAPPAPAPGQRRPQQRAGQHRQPAADGQGPLGGRHCRRTTVGAEAVVATVRAATGWVSLELAGGRGRRGV